MSNDMSTDDMNLNKEKPFDFRVMLRDFYFKIWGFIGVIVLLTFSIYIWGSAEQIKNLDEVMTKQLRSFLMTTSIIMIGVILIAHQKRVVYKKHCAGLKKKLEESVRKREGKDLNGV